MAQATLAPSADATTTQPNLVDVKVLNDKPGRESTYVKFLNRNHLHKSDPLRFGFMMVLGTLFAMLMANFLTIAIFHETAPPGAASASGSPAVS